MVESLLAALRARDPYTYGHCCRVSSQARLLAEAAGLSVYDQTRIEYASIFHDIGKIGIPDAILLKRSRLTTAEERVMQEHPERGVSILKPLESIPFFADIIPGILHHHERIDGRGYPYGLAGDSIPLEARVIIIADTFDAMTTTRPYRNKLDHEKAYQELKQFAGRQFDAQLVRIFLRAHPTWELLTEAA